MYICMFNYVVEICEVWNLIDFVDITSYSMVELVDFPKELDHEDMCVTLETH